MTAVIFAGSLMAETITINATDVTTIESGATTGLDVTLQGVRIVWEGAYYNNDQSKDIRVYANKTLALTAESAITKVEIVGYGKKGLTVSASAGSVVCADASAGEITKSDWEDPLIVVSDINAKTVTLTCTKQMRAFAVRLTLGEGGSDEPGDEPGDEPQPVTDPTNCAEAAAAALSVAENNALYNDGKEYTIQGFVTEIAYALKDGSMSFWMADTKDGGKVLEAYKCAVDDEANAPAVGDKVAVTGKLTKYNTTPEFAAGCTVEILEKGEVVPVDPVKEPTNCAEAAAAALSVAENNALYNDGKEYTIQGFVTEIAYALKDGSMSFWMADTKDGGKVLEAYKCAVDDEANAPAVGDKVAVTGKLTKYNTTPEFAAGCTVEILEKGEVIPEDPAKNLGEKTIAEFLELKNTKDTCVLTGIVANIKNATYGNFDLVELNNAEISVYVYGLLTAAGESKQFESLGVAEGDTLTVLAIYSEFNEAPQVKNAIFVSVKKAAVEPGETIDLSFTDGVQYADYAAEEGWWQFTFENDDYYISFSNSVIVEQAAGTYSVDDLDSEYSFLYLMESESYVSFVSGSLVLAETQTGATLSGELIGDDGNTYHINLVFVEPKAETTVELNIAAQLNDYTKDETADYPFYQVMGVDMEKAVGVSLVIYSDQIVGQYDESYLNPNYSYVLIMAEVEEESESISIYKADIVVVANADGTFTLTADLLCYGNTLYKLTMTIPAQEEGIEDVLAGKKAVKLFQNGTVVIEKNGVRYNMNGTVIR